jgi:hypothetical protein
MVSEDFVTLSNQEFEKVDIEFSKRTNIRIAQRTRFTKCTITLNPKGIPQFRFRGHFYVAHSVIEDSTIVSIGKVKALEFTNEVKVHRCRFVGGPFVEAKFGPENQDGQVSSMVVECDFSRADLHDARFYQTPLDTLVLPPWPYITVVAQEDERIFAPPSHRRPALTTLFDEVSNFPWEDLPLQRALESLVFGVGVRPNEASIQVCHAEDVVKRGAGSVERLRAALGQFAHPAIRY